MAAYRDYINQHFSSCRKLAETRDEHRDRAVTVFMIPGEFEVVGVSDGTDAWIAPVAADPFRINIRAILGDIRAGNSPEVARRKERVAIVVPNVPETTKPRRRVHVNAE